MPAEAREDDDRFIIVTGPGRSGTSAVSRVLHESGVRMGVQFDPPSSYNARGFFEELRVCKLNDRIMADCGMEGIGYWPSRREVLDNAAAYEREMIALADEGGASGWKDPRFSLTLEAWLPHLPSLPRVVVCLRSPEAFVHSVVNIFGLAPREALEQWWANHLRRTLDVIRDYGLEATCVEYEELVAKPEETVAALAAFLETPLDAGFVEPELRQFSQDAPARHAALCAEVRSLRQG